MDIVSAGFWGAFFGVAALMFAVAIAAFAGSLRRVALMAALSSVVSALFVLAYLGGLPVGGPEAQARLLAHVAVFAAVVLALMLLSMLGLLRRRDTAARSWRSLGALGFTVLAVGWALLPFQALLLSSAAAGAVGLAMLAVAVRSALRGDRLAWGAVSGVCFMLVAVGGLTWIAFHRDAPWQLHALSALAGMAYLGVMAGALWVRYSYLLDLAEVMAHGPAYDPVTRMRSQSETGNLLGDVFLRKPLDEKRSVGLIVVSVANLYTLEKLHGRAAANHALFRCANRLRRAVPAYVQMGRLAEDGFLLLVRDANDGEALVQMARLLRERLVQTIVIASQAEPGKLDSGGLRWNADVGIGVLSAPAAARPAQALATVRAMSRTAWTYPSRIALFDQAAGQIAEVPLAPAA